MTFQFGIARSLYKAHRHPRLLCDEADLERIKKQVRTGQGKKIYSEFRRKVRVMVEAIEDHPDKLAPLIGHQQVRKDPRGVQVVGSLPDIALVGILENDQRAMRAIRRVLVGIPEADAAGPNDSYSLAFGNFGAIAPAYDLAYNAMTPEERAIFCCWAVDHSIRGSLAKITKNNFLRSSAHNQCMVGLFSSLPTLLAIEGDPGVPDLSVEKAALLQYFEASVYASLGPGGYPNEDIGYGTAMVCYMARVVEAVRRAGLFDAYTQCPRYTRFGQALLHFIQPWGTYTSNTGDYGADFGPRSMVLPRLATETNDPTILWLSSTLTYPIASAWAGNMKRYRGTFPEVELSPGNRACVDTYALLTLDDLKKPVHPSKARKSIPTQFMDPQRGIVTFRSSWKKDATFVVFDGSQRSPSSAGHEHDSGGHFSISALGEYFAIDTGRYNIEQDQHNLVLMEGKSGQTTGGNWRMSYYHAVLTGYHPGKFVDTASADNSHQSNCYWSYRTLGLVKGTHPYVWIADDVNADHCTNGPREFWWTMNVNPNHKIKIAGESATVIGNDHGNMLDVHFSLPSAGGYPTPHKLSLEQDVKLAGSQNYLGPDGLDLARKYSKTVGNLQYGPVFARPRLIGKVHGYNGRFLSIMIPRRKGEKSAKVEQLPTFDNALAVRITFNDVQDTLIWAYEHGLLEAGDVKARGQWVLVRKSRRGGRLMEFAVGGEDGYLLK